MASTFSVATNDVIISPDPYYNLLLCGINFVMKPKLKLRM